jgi:hypothetical protein
MIFEDTDSIPTLDEISRELVQGLPVEFNDPKKGRAEWTKGILLQLRKMGTERGMSVRGWLLDLIWMVEERREIVLGVESEWGDASEVQDDFDKLMSIKARRKLLLFSTNKRIPSAPQEVLRHIEQSMRAYPYHLAGEEYMALDVRGTQVFRYHFHVPTDGRLDAVCFESVGVPLDLPA